MRPRLYLPAGPLRRFRLPRAGAGLDDRARRTDNPWRLILLVPFASFAAIAGWLASDRRLPDFSRWFTTEAPSAATPTTAPAAPSVVQSAAPRVEHRAEPPEVPSGGPSPAPFNPPPPSKRTRRPPLALDGHRLRPVVEWQDTNPEERSTATRE